MGRDARIDGLIRAACVVFVLVLAACGEGADPVPSSFVPIVLDQSDPERLLRYYFGGYVTPKPGDAFEAELLHRVEGRLYVDRTVLERHHPDLAGSLEDADGNGRIDWEEFEAFIHHTYYEARSIPETRVELIRAASFSETDPDWMQVDVDGVMTTARRRVFVRVSRVRAALDAYVANDETIIYPVGTTFIGEHVLDGRLAETTVMRKREDGYWDFFVYGSDGRLADGTATPPRELDSPVQCVGCHFGDKVFEPEESFPARARPGPHGPRQVVVGDEARDEEVVRFFNEHRKRSDTILGLYTTLFVSRLRAERRRGSLTAVDASLLDTLDL